MTKLKCLRALPLALALFTLLAVSPQAFASDELYPTQQGQTLDQADYGSPAPEGSAVSGDQLYLDSSGGLQKKVPGVGASLGEMLDSLISLTGGSESQVRQIIANFPILLPDLYKVFITL